MQGLAGLRVKHLGKALLMFETWFRLGLSKSIALPA